MIATVKEFHGYFRGMDTLGVVPIYQARWPSTMAENRQFMNFFSYRRIRILFKNCDKNS